MDCEDAEKELTDDELHEVLAVVFEFPTPEQTQQAKNRLHTALQEKEKSFVVGTHY
jgi:hypothetical protein